jgi:carboxymethylenebutenolidase
MAGEWITVPAADGGSFRAYLSRPAKGSGPGLLLLQEIFGVNETMRAHADQLAGSGYAVVVPDLFWRLQPGVELDYSPEGWQRAFELYGRFDENKAVEDIAATLEVLRRHPACAGKVGAIGYCLGGKLAFLTGCRTDVDGSVCYYGVGIEKNLDEIGNIKGPMVMHFAELDKFAPPEAVAKIKAAAAGRPDIEIYGYPGVDHAFARVGGDHYDEASAKLANSRSLAFLHRVLGPA